MNMYELMCQFDSRQSFYHKAIVQVEGNKKTLFSYETEVAFIENGKLTMLDEAWYSNTTRRHVREFAKQNHVADQLQY